MSALAKTIPKEIVYLDLFSGTGGFALGLKQAGFVFKRHYFSEIDKYAVANYQYHFKNAQGLGSITNISGNQIERPDVISFGSPCQDLSLAGKRKGIKGKRSGLFFEALRLIRAYKPRVFIFENVKGIFSSNGGKDFQAVLRAFADIGLYDIQWQLVNTAWLLPQNRERIYLVGHLRGTGRPEIFPIGESNEVSGKIRKKGKQNQDIASAITSNYSKGVHGRGETYIDTCFRVPVASEKKFQEACHGDSINLAYLSSNKKNNRVGKGRAHTIDTKNLQSVVDHGCVRRLTPLECERLQGFPDNWTTKGLNDKIISDISDTQRYKLLGNAVSVIMVKTIASKLRKNSSAKTLSGITGVIQKLPLAKEDFVAVMQQDLIAKKHHTKITVEKLAATLAIYDKTEIKELIELAIVIAARRIALDDSLFLDEKYHHIVDLYNSQVTLSHRTSQSILLQQYSTPAPIGFMMGTFCGIDQLHKKGGFALEPSAGNGLLTIAARPEQVDVNEVDEVRRRNLASQGYAHVWDRDASKPFSDLRHRYKAVITNPPFGMLDTKMVFDGYPIQPLEHVMAIQALDCMEDDGKAAFIIGGHTHWDNKGRIQAGKNRLFFNYLYKHYHVADVILIDGKKLYSRQGTGFDTRLVLINRRKEKPEGAAPVYDKEHDVVVHSFDDLYNRVMGAMNLKEKEPETVFWSTTAIRYEKEYLPLLEKHTPKLVLQHYYYNYEAMGEWALFITKHFDFDLSTQFLYKDQRIPLVRIPEKKLLMVVEHLNKMKTPFIIVEGQRSSHKKDMITLEAEAKVLLSSFRAGDLGSSPLTNPDDALFEQLRRRYQIYQVHQRRCNGALLLYRNGNFYEIFGRDVGFLKHFLKIPVHAAFPYEGEIVGMAKISAEFTLQMLPKLERMSYRYILSDNHDLSYPVQRTIPSTMNEQPLWEIPLPIFLQSEQGEYEIRTNSVYGSGVYDLPYKPEYVGIFNSLLNDDPYEPAGLNPYSPDGILELENPLFRELCLTAIHEFEILMAMSQDIVLSEAVLKGYPRLKLKQEAKITYLKTLVQAGPQLNGTY